MLSTKFILTALVVSLWTTNSYADASKQFLYRIDHTQLKGYTTNPPPSYTQSIAVGVNRPGF